MFADHELKLVCGEVSISPDRELGLRRTAYYIAFHCKTFVSRECGGHLYRSIGWHDRNGARDLCVGLAHTANIGSSESPIISNW